MCNPAGDLVLDNTDNKSLLLCSSTISLGCANTPNLNSTALVDTADNIFLPAGELSNLSTDQTQPKSVLQPKEDRLDTSETLFCCSTNFQLWPRSTPGPRDPMQPCLCRHSADAYCKLFFQKTGCKISINGEIILQGLPQTPQINSINKCKNAKQLIHFYYATIGYPVVSTCIKAINKAYFLGWRGLTSGRVRWFIKPSEHGQMDQKQTGMSFTKSSNCQPLQDTMDKLEQAPNSDETNMVFVTLPKIKGQLPTDQTGCFPITSNRGNNYIVIFTW
eukprot:CCRYP_019987-RA/>CCRYP_019987-RA protein AED:0.25 eAED:0.25 QI:0/0/0/1/0/0/2/0/275